MLNEEPLANRIYPGIKKQLAHTIQPVITGPNNTFDGLVASFNLFFDYLCVILHNVGERLLFQDFLPQILRPDLGIYPRVASTTIHAFVERQEPAVLALSSSSTAKWTAQRLGAKSGSEAGRSFWYCLIAF